MDSKLRTYVIIGGAVAAAAIIIIAITGAFDNKMGAPTQITDQQTTSNSQETVTFKEEQPLGPPTEITNTQTSSQLYRINTSCELLYAMTVSEYPNGERLHNLTLTGIVSKYRTDFEPWRGIFFDEEKIRAFIDQGFSPEFLDAFANAVMLEYSINPEQKSTMLLALDPKNSTMSLNKIFEEDNCMEYFVSRKGLQNTQP